MPSSIVEVQTMAVFCPQSELLFCQGAVGSAHRAVVNKDLDASAD